MATKVPEEASHSESEGENLALRIKKKRARRVSFADTEITSVHIFRRDDDYETPPDSKPSSRDAADGGNAGSRPENGVLGFFRDLGGDSDDSGDDEESVDGRKSFLRPMGSPSPGGSSTAGSATSNDEDNFFGPVSSSFIRPGRLSDSGVSDDIHEETLDTTAFSLHYRSLARSDSEEVRTPTAVRLVFEEKTATKDTNPTDSGSLMAITEPKKLSSQSLVLLEKVGGGEDSDDMSIEDNNPNRYDYGTLSPTLDALLAEGSKDPNAHSVDVLMGSKSPMGSEGLRSDQYGASQMGYFDSHENSAEAAFISHTKLCGTNGNVDLVAFDSSFKGNDGPTPSASDHETRSSDHLIIGSKRFTQDATFGKVVSRLEFPTTHSGSQQNEDGKALQIDIDAQHEYANRPFNDSSVRKSSPRTVRHDSDTVLDQQHGSPLEASTLSSARRQQLILNTSNSARGLYVVSPFSKQPDLQSNEHMKHGESTSRFKITDQSYSGSSIKQGTDKLIRRLSKYSSISSPFGSALDENSKALQSKYLGTPVAGLKQQLFSADPKNVEDRSLVSLDMNQIETPRSTSRLDQKDSTVLAKYGDRLHSISIDNMSKDKPNKLPTAALSPFRLPSSGIQMMQHSLISEDSTKNMLFTSITDSVLIDDEEINLPRMHIESETLRNVQSLRDKVNLNFQLENSEKKLQTVKSTLLSTSYSPQGKESSTQNVFRREQTQNSEGETPSQKAARKDLMDVFSRINPTERSPRTLLSRSPLMKEPNSTSPKKILTQSSPGKEPSQSPRVKELNCSPLGNKTDQSPSRKEQRKSPYRLDQSNASHGHNILFFLRKDVETPRSTSSRDSSDNLNLKDSLASPLSTKDVEISFERKRGSAAVVLVDGNRTYKSPRIQKSPDVLKSRNYDSELMSYEVDKVFNETDKNEGDRTQKHWLNILEKFSRDTEQFFPPSKNMLNFKAVRTLEDFLNYFLKVRNYEMLGSEIQSEKAADHFSRKHKKRVAETRLLLCKMVQEKAKLQLMGAQHEKLLEKIHILKSGIHECQKLKSDIQQSKIGGRDTQPGDYDLQSRSVSLNSEHQVQSSAVDTMKQEINVLDGKINSLSKLFQSYCKLKEEPSRADTFASIQDDLIRRKCCRLIRQDLQLWKVDAFECQNNFYNILLNYQGYLSQRFTLNSGPVSSIIISNQLNDTKILKIFPNMDALVAFAFVFNNAKVTKRGIDSKCFGQEIQVTNSLVCNLLDVVEEVQMAQIEIGNLIWTDFHSPSDQQLNLQLCFINFHTGAKATLILDVTCLNSGTYPSEILPHEVQVPLAGSQKAKSLLDELRSAFEHLEAGYLRIIRLCRCVSQLLQASTT